MIKISEAWKIVKNANPNMKVLVCNEVDDYYVFSLVPDDLAEDDFFAGGAVDIVDKKTGAYKTAHFTYVIHRPILKEYDVDIFNKH